jgi:hypothetical protein
MYVTKLCVRMSYVKSCKKIVCERVVREKWFVKHDKIVCGTGVGQVACERHPHPSPTMGKPGVDPNAR